MKKILIADDDSFIMETLENVISGFPNVELTSVYSGTSLVEKAKNNDYDFILTDNVMDGLLGIEAIKEIRKLGKKCPIYLMSGTASLEEAMKAGATGFIQKPFTFKQIKDAIEQYLK